MAGTCWRLRNALMPGLTAQRDEARARVAAKLENEPWLAASLAGDMQSSAAAETVDLGRSTLTNRDLLVLAAAFRQREAFPRLKELDLNGNEIGDIGLHALCVSWENGSLCFSNPDHPRDLGRPSDSPECSGIW